MSKDKTGEVTEATAFSWFDGFFWGVMAAFAFALAIILISMRWHP